MLKSDIFQNLYQQVMTTVEVTASYLDGPGRIERGLKGPIGEGQYSRSAMALTTHLMQQASQALMLRSIRDGEMSIEAARVEFQKMATINKADLSLDGSQHLPPRLRELMEVSVSLKNKLSRFYDQLADPKFNVVPNKVHEHLSLLSSSFAS